MLIQRLDPSDIVMESNVEMESKEEDMTYVPSEDDETEDEILENEIDADIWLKDVEHPSSSRRSKGRR